MSDSFEVQSSAGTYTVRFGENPPSLAAGANQPIVLCDRFFAEAYRARNAQVIAVEATEAAKSLDRMGDIITAMRQAGANRNTEVLAIGGGVIQDIATFVASVYMRGLRWYYLPTTLLGMVDSCIGGKSSINVGPYKNLIGNFYPPDEVVIDLRFIDSLNTEQRVAGLCEAVKICFAFEGQAFDEYLALQPQPDSPRELMGTVIALTLKTKRWFIEIDEHDQKERLLLNFGHTFGHAIEGACNFTIPHGVAVGIGMLAALALAAQNNPGQPVPERSSQLRAYLLGLLRQLPDLRAWIASVDRAQLLDRFEADKKHGSAHYTVVIPERGGQLARVRLDKNDANRQLLAKAFAAALDDAVAVAPAC